MVMLSPKFKARSSKHLQGCHDLLRELFNGVIEKRDIAVICGLRSALEQNAEFMKRASQLDGFKRKSKHQVGHVFKGTAQDVSLAADVVPYPVTWRHRVFIDLARVVFKEALDKKIPIRWGGDWNQNFDFEDQKMVDMPHWELIDPDKCTWVGHPLMEEFVFSEKTLEKFYGNYK